MTRHPLTWLASELGWSEYVGFADGAVVSSADPTPRHDVRLEEVVRTAVPISVAERAVAAVRAARLGIPKVLSLPAGGRLICWPEDDESIHVVISTPESSVGSASLQSLSGAASHEMANALTSIAGWAELGLSGGGSPMEALGAIRESARTARETAADLLGIVRSDRDPVQGPRIVKAPEPVDSDRLCADVARLISPQANRRGITVVYRPSDAPHGRGPRARVVSILWNLVHNAVAVGKHGGTVEVWADAADDGVEFNVRDDGPGMSKEIRARIFDPYFTTRAEGTGIGLALVRTLVDELGGSIDLKTREGQGAWFRVRLPAAGPVPRRASGVLRRQPRILVVENDRTLREMLELSLTMHHFDVATASCTAAADAHGGTVDVVVADLHLDDGDGIELVQRMLSEGRAARGLIISGGAAPFDCELPWLRKPFQPTDLAEKLRGLLIDTPVGVGVVG